MGETLESLRAPSFLVALIAEQDALRIQGRRIERRLAAIAAAIATYDPAFMPDEFLSESNQGKADTAGQSTAQSDGVVSRTSGGVDTPATITLPAPANNAAAIDGEGAGVGLDALPVDTNSVAVPSAADDEGSPALTAEVVPPTASAKISEPEPSGEPGESPAVLVDQSGEDNGEDRPDLQVLPDIHAAPTGSIRQRLTALHAEHPDWTAGQYQRAMPGSNYNTISTTLTEVRREARKTTTSAHSPDPAPEPAPAVERPPTVKSEAPAINIKDRIKALNKSEPHLDCYAAAERLGVSPGSIRSFSAEMNLRWEAPRPLSSVEFHEQPQMLTLRSKVAAIHRQHPTWTARMITDHLGANYNSVSGYLTDIRGEAKDTGESAPIISEAAMRDEAIARKRRLGVAV